MKYYYEVIKYDDNIPGMILMQHKSGNRCDTSPHWHRELEFVYMIDGCLDVKIGGKSLQINDGEFYFCNSEEIHSTNAPSKTRVIKYIVVILSHDYLRKTCANLDSIQFKIPDEARPKFKALFDELVGYAESNSPYNSLRLKSVMMKIYFLLLDECMVFKKNNVSSSVASNFVYAKKIIEYIGINYAEPITLNIMADMVGLTPNYLSKYFKDITEISLIQYVNRIRLEHALNDILTCNDSVTQAALNNGFPNIKSFISTCKSVYGLTPLQYKKEYLKNI